MEQLLESVARSHVPMPLDTAHQAELWTLLKRAHPDVDPLTLLDIISETLTYMVVGATS